MTIFDFKPRSDAAIVRNLLSEIEAAQNSGASRQDLWRNLRDRHHLKLSFDAFCVALKRARAKKREKASAEHTGPPLALTAEKAERHKESAPEDIEDPKHLHAFDPLNHFCTRGTEPTSESSPRKNRIKTSRDFADVHKLDFNEFDDKFK
ncbi:hypothetical protein [Caballeronia zhejiangensis]|uniref:hypothetical protein n=1 Tax=Caballeronia zhejiangensis TaxID=871203 RepID=UPI001F528BD6|nr:hypothetical protein [Caballeronia zhejiangensis]MCI1047058.1 hypothetical protein [Caballeronia zhejiangensis]